MTINDFAGSRLLVWETEHGTLSDRDGKKARDHIIGPLMGFYRLCRTRFLRR